MSKFPLKPNPPYIPDPYIIPAKDDINSSNNSNGWISVKERLPETDEDVLWCNPHSGIVIVAPYNHKFDGELGEQYFTHWMLVPAMPKGEA